MACSSQRAQAIHTVDEAWTELIDRINGMSWSEATAQLRTLNGWKRNGLPKKLGPVTQARLIALAWLAMSEAAIRATDARNQPDGKDGDTPCV